MNNQRDENAVPRPSAEDRSTVIVLKLGSRGARGREPSPLPDASDVPAKPDGSPSPSDGDDDDPEPIAA